MEITFGDAETLTEIGPIMVEMPDGTFRDSSIVFTSESISLSFLTMPRSLQVGMVGQLSTRDKGFLEVTVSLIMPFDHFERVYGKGERQLEPRIEDG